jgi:hypothetical protein
MGGIVRKVGFEYLPGKKNDHLSQPNVSKD